MELVKRILESKGKIYVERHGLNFPEEVTSFTINQLCHGLVIYDYPNAKETAETLAIELVEKLVAKGDNVTETDVRLSINQRYWLLTKCLMDVGYVKEEKYDIPLLFVVCKDLMFECSEKEENMIDFLITKGENIHQEHKGKNLLSLELGKSNKYINWNFVEKLLRLGVKPPRCVPTEVYTPFVLTQIKLQNERILDETGSNRDVTALLVDFLKCSNLNSK